jgi:hypothetical protein
MRLLLFLLTTVLPIAAQQPATPEGVYRIVYKVTETSPGEQAKSRQYSVLLKPKVWGKIRSGTKVPYLVEKDKYSYTDTGFNVDCRLQETGEQISLDTKVEISTVVAGGNLPRIENMRSESDATVALNKTTQIASVDERSRHYAIDVTVSKP